MGTSFLITSSGIKSFSDRCFPSACDAFLTTLKHSLIFIIPNSQLGLIVCEGPFWQMKVLFPSCALGFTWKHQTRFNYFISPILSNLLAYLSCVHYSYVRYYEGCMMIIHCLSLHWAALYETKWPGKKDLCYSSCLNRRGFSIDLLIYLFSRTMHFKNRTSATCQN